MGHSRSTTVNIRAVDEFIDPLMGHRLDSVFGSETALPWPDAGSTTAPSATLKTPTGSSLP